MYERLLPSWGRGPGWVNSWRGYLAGVVLAVWLCRPAASQPFTNYMEIGSPTFSADNQQANSTKNNGSQSIMIRSLKEWASALNHSGSPYHPNYNGVYSWPLTVNQSRMIESCELHLLREGLSKTG